MIRPLKERFWLNVEKSTGCWKWKSATTTAGYGVFGINGKVVYAHRAAWEKKNGNIPKGVHVLHRCDNPPCINPKHLFLGTPADNCFDKELKGRGMMKRYSGENNWQSKLNKNEVSEIRNLYSLGKLSQRAIAKKYKVSQPNISGIINMDLWSCA